MGKLARLAKLFAGRHFDREVIILCVRWYLRFRLSLRDLVEMMAEPSLSLAHTTIMRWVQRYTPEFEKRWHRYALAVGQSWRVDETYVKIKGEWGICIVPLIGKVGQLICTVHRHRFTGWRAVELMASASRCPQPHSHSRSDKSWQA